MVGNKKDMAQITHALVDFVGEESAEQFVAWLSDILPTYEAKGAAGDDQAAAAVADAKPAQDAAAAPSAAPPAKRIISLKSSSTASANPKLVSLSSSRGSIRSLSRGQAPADDVLAKRSQRFGVVEKSPPKQKPAREEPKAAGSSKRKASAEPESSSTPAQTQPRRGSGGRLSQLLGPPVNVDQAELDARDSLHTNKKKKTNPRAAEPERERPGRSNGSRNDRTNQENHDSDGNRKSARRPEQKDRPAPPLPPNDQPERSDKFGAPRDGGGRGPQQGGYYNGPPGYGGFPPPVRLPHCRCCFMCGIVFADELCVFASLQPYGHPMYFQPPPFGQMPPPYGMGFPPPHGGPGYYGGPGPYGGRRASAPMGGAAQGGRAPRAGFQNRTWVNPNVAKAEETKGEGEGADAATQAGSSSGAGALNPGAPAFTPRNPYYGSQMRPFFQNKTWVRQEPAKDEELSLTLPTTPPLDGADAAAE